MRWRASRFSPLERSSAARPRRAFVSPRRCRSPTSKQSRPKSIATVDELAFDPVAACLRARRRRRLGALVLAEQTLAIAPDEANALALARGVLSLGLERLPWTKALEQWRDRVMFLRRAEGGAWPDLSNGTLSSDPNWLSPFLAGRTRLDEIGADVFSDALRALLPRELARRLDRGGADPFSCADRDRRADRLCGGGRPGDCAQGAGIVRAERPPVAGRRARAADASSALARPSSDPDHPRPARFLARLMGRGALRPSRPLPAPRVAGGPCERDADPSREAARDVRSARFTNAPSPPTAG